MKHISTAILASLVVTIPALNAYPNNVIPAFSTQRSSEIPDLRNLSYDEVMDLLALIESDSFEERCSIDELEQANLLISFLALEGATENQKADVERSIASLFNMNYSQYACWMDSNMQCTVQPAIFRDESQNITLCRSWIKEKWDQTRKLINEIENVKNKVD